ncbi:5-formyltetrahydrofolate cyclo-ligase [Mesorhizobium sp. DCY119]|uniref:5-formyltetrahydrofolate cyclo-ligase n=1 Tax=Mesorhizobium sp. DCY119 TaxID=2108445 RepID=UPI000E6CF049|nr:5-formyltetrahydrofolate cyclo-ligase [Mesorhizobium sp. DCY119]RJG43029.1 5-formyltetrahydrofolate cyclo-ligase [Mesorhizobium sp. DCY119]
MDSEDDAEARGYASPPCFMHELTPDGRPADLVAWTDVARWRKAERKRLIDERMAVPAEERSARTETIAAALTGAIENPEKQLIGIYWPFRAEPDLRGWMNEMIAAGAKIALPVVIEAGSPLDYRQWAPGEPLERGVWNILVPSNGPAVFPTVVIAPLVGFDGENYRLGYGGGFFDRTLAAMPKKPLVIGIGYAQARLATIYPQPHDIPMDRIITG